MKAQVFKIHSDFYYLQTPSGIIEAKLRDVLKKQDTSVVVGDYVGLSEIKGNQAFISEIYERKNFIPKPKAANIDQVVIVSSLKSPDISYEQLNRYICFCGYYKLEPILCFSKNDLLFEDELIKEIKDIYSRLNYKTIFISALEKIGMEQLEEVLKNKTSVLCGMSGVGKSTLLNVLRPDLNLKTKPVSEKTNKGTHTTRHCEIVSITFSDKSVAKIVDTPGFSNLKFDFLMPAEISLLFKEINKLKDNCKYKDCLHITEDSCNVLNNLENIHKSRYDSYLSFVEEAREYKKVVDENGKKEESRHKKINNQTVAKINTKKRVATRRKVKQQLTGLYEEEE